MKDVVERWRSYGLLEGVPKEKEALCAEKLALLEEFMSLVPENLKEEYYRRAEVIGFAALRRILDLIKYGDIDVEHFFEKLLQDIRNNYDDLRIKMRGGHLSIDVEAEYTVLFCDRYIDSV
jgi:hypothetical protein